MNTQPTILLEDLGIEYKGIKEDVHKGHLTLQILQPKKHTRGRRKPWDLGVASQMMIWGVKFPIEGMDKWPKIGRSDKVQHTRGCFDPACSAGDRGHIEAGTRGLREDVTSQKS